MLRITNRTEGTDTVLEIEGSLAGPWVKELESCWRQVVNTPDQPRRIVLTEVTFIDDEGRVLLTEISRHGTELVAKGCMTNAIVDEIIQSETNS